MLWRLCVCVGEEMRGWGGGMGERRRRSIDSRLLINTSQLSRAHLHSHTHTLWKQLSMTGIHKWLMCIILDLCGGTIFFSLYSNQWRHSILPLSPLRTNINPNVQNMKKIADLYAEVIGILSQSRFHSVKRRFFLEIRDSQNNSSTVISIIEGMSFIRVKMFPVEELEQWFLFLQVR